MPRALRFVLVLVLALAFAGSSLFFACSRQKQLGPVAPGSPSCTETKACPYAYECDKAQCRASACSEPDPNGSVGLRSCEKGVCEYDSEDDRAHGNGSCSSL